MFGQKRAGSVAVTALIVLSVGLLVASCSQPLPGVPNVSSASPTKASVPSDQEMYASLMASYQAYLDVADQILADGGQSANRIESVSTSAYATDFKTDAAEYASAGLRSVGSTEVKTASLQSWSQDGSGFKVTAYVCDDVTGVDVLNSEGVSVVSPDRDPTTPYEVSFEGATVSPLLVTSRELWMGADFCDE